MNKNNSLWIVIGVALIIGLLAGIVGSNITGNAVFGSTSSTPGCERKQVNLNSLDKPSLDVTLLDSIYNISLVAANDNFATIKVTNISGWSDSIEIREGSSKEILGVSIYIKSSDESLRRLRVTLTASLCENVVAEKTIDRLNKASLVVAGIPLNTNSSCNQECSRYGKVCVTAGTLSAYDEVAERNANLRIYSPQQCSQYFTSRTNSTLGLVCRCA
ncbi:hypothetical protein J4205_00010 [Candidatus Pacearchaeota archaeon]|nr:hypothetical protein [Candidatus Pacearchaeota archaeon]